MKEQIIQILSNLRPEFDFSDSNLRLIDDGLLDSFDIVSLVSELDSMFAIEIKGEDIIPENFNSLEAIINLVNEIKKS